MINPENVIQCKRIIGVEMIKCKKLGMQTSFPKIQRAPKKFEHFFAIFGK